MNCWSSDQRNGRPFLDEAPPHLVGTREPAAFAVDAARKTAEAFAGAGWIVTAGLARGIDTVAHQAAVEAGGITAAVLGNGLDTVYPRENGALALRIVETGGALISEQDLGERVTAANLVRRNRLQSGLSATTVVCKTDLKGGTMHTARFAQQQGRLLFCPTPRPPFHDQPKSRGLKYLLANGAIPIGQETLAAAIDMCERRWESLRREKPPVESVTLQVSTFDL